MVSESHIFGHGGAEAEARKLGINFLGKIPLEMDIRINADAGTPIVTSQPDSAHTEAYRAIARSLLGQLDDTPAQRAQHHDQLALTFQRHIGMARDITFRGEILTRCFLPQRGVDCRKTRCAFGGQINFRQLNP